MDTEFNRLYIFGAGGSGRETAWLAEQSLGDKVELVFLVDQRRYLSDLKSEIPIKLVSSVVIEKGDRFVAAVGDASLRRHAVLTCLNVGLKPFSLIHPRVEMAAPIDIGEGSLICAGSIVTTNVAIGKHVQVNINCTISHDVRIGDYTTISPGAHIAGHVDIGRDVFIGIGANIINGTREHPLVIGDGAVVAAGACVTQSVEAGALVAGIPAVRKR